MTFGAVCFGDYGDARALPLLEQAIEIYVPDYPESLGLTGLADLVEAYERLGGTLPEPLRARVDQFRVEWKVRQQSRSTPSRDGALAKAGRNDPCRCGSRKKDKECCLPGNAL